MSLAGFDVSKTVHVRLFATGRAVLEATAAAATGLSGAEKQAVLSGTAERIHRIRRAFAQSAAACAGRKRSSISRRRAATSPSSTSSTSS